MCFKLTEDVQEFDSKVWIPIVHLLFPSALVYVRALNGSLTHFEYHHYVTDLSIIVMLLLTIVNPMPCKSYVHLSIFFVCFL